MTVNVAFDGSVIDTADTVGNWTGVKITSGGGFAQPTAADAAYEGLNNITLRSDNKRVYAYVDVGAGNEIDFTAGQAGAGTVDGSDQMFYIWVNFLPSPLLALQSEGGLGIFMGVGGATPGSSQYALWYIHGRDTYTGGWVRLAIDPNKLPSIEAGTAFDPGNVRYFGAFAHNNQGTAKYDNFVIDQCARGKGLIITGSSTLGLAEELLADEEANRHGIVTPLNDSGTASQIAGKLTFGDSVGTALTNITDEDSKFFAAEPLYYETTLKTACPLTFMGMDIVGNGTGATDVAFGQAVGADNGRNGISLVGNDSYNFTFDRDDGSVESSDFYGCSFENLTGTLALDGTHDFNGATLVNSAAISVASNTSNMTSVGSGQITPAASVVLANSLIINNTGSSSVSTSDLGNVDKCIFSKGVSGHAVELSGVAASYGWNCTATGYDTGTASAGVQVTGGSITGNEHIHVTASTGTFTISVATGATIPSVSSAGAIVNVESGGVLIDVNVKNESGGNITGALVYIDEDLVVGGNIANTTTNANGDIVQASYTGAVTSAILRIRLYGYKPFLGTITLTQNSATNVILITDPQQT